MEPENKWRRLAMGGMMVILLAAGWWAGYNQRNFEAGPAPAKIDEAALEQAVIPSQGYILPVKWGDLGKRLVDAGVIDKTKFIALYDQRGGLDAQEKKLLDDAANGNLTIDPSNADTLLNLLWAFGLANKNQILTNGPMNQKQYGGAANFASTGGWTLASGDAMRHFAMHELVALTLDQQALVERVSKQIFRPCCGNSTYFPDCNHGMAMLGLLELMAAQNVSERDMFKAALAVNSYWFPDTYLTIAQYEQQRGIAWNKVDPQTVLGADFSSASGYQRISRSVVRPGQQQGGSCGV